MKSEARRPPNVIAALYPACCGFADVERGVEIVSEASRHLTDELKARHPEIPWQKVAGIGNVLRHDYESIAAPIMWKLAQADLLALEKVCR